MFKWQDFYDINESGEVWSKRTRIILKTYKTKDGYERVCMSFKNKNHNFYIHRLLAEKYIPNPEAKPCINHINNNPSDNRIENLEWCDYFENIAHAKNQGRLKHGESHYRSKLSESDVLNIIEGLSDGFKQKDIAKFYSVTAPNINSIALGKSWGWLTGVGQ